MEALISMLSGLNNRSTLSYTKPRDNYDQSKEFDESSRRTNPNFRTSNRGFSLNKPNQRQMKDPDVWDPPPPMDKKMNQPVKKATKNVSYSQPYNAKGRPGAKKGLDANGKPSFLLDRYPDGNGPDTNLIEML